MLLVMWVCVHLPPFSYIHTDQWFFFVACNILTRLAKHTLPPPKGCIWSCNVVQLALHRSNSTTTKNYTNYWDSFYVNGCYKSRVARTVATCGCIRPNNCHILSSFYLHTSRGPIALVASNFVVFSGLHLSWDETRLTAEDNSRLR